MNFNILKLSCTLKEIILRRQIVFYVDPNLKPYLLFEQTF